ncbi:MAG: Lrp/AsnC family transcriptional regulator [archaeon]
MGKTEQKLDKKDHNILKELCRDGRVSLATIAQRVDLSQEVVRYRIKRLHEKKVIRDFLAVLNPAEIGFTTLNEVLVSFHSLTPEAEEKIARYLHSSQYIVNAKGLVGRYDYAITIAARDQGHFSEILKRFRQAFGERIKDYEILGIISEPRRMDYTAVLEGARNVFI